MKNWPVQLRAGRVRMAQAASATISGRRQARVREILHTLPPAAQAAILDDLEGTHQLPTHTFAGEPAHGAHHAD